MIAEAVQDSQHGNEILLLVGMKRSVRPIDTLHLPINTDRPRGFGSQKAFTQLWKDLTWRNGQTQ